MSSENVLLTPTFTFVVLQTSQDGVVQRDSGLDLPLKVENIGAKSPLEQPDRVLGRAFGMRVPRLLNSRPPCVGRPKPSR